MAEYQLGLPWYMDVGVIDVKTCQPIPNILVDVWHANSTGHCGWRGLKYFRSVLIPL